MKITDIINRFSDRERRWLYLLSTLLAVFLLREFVYVKIADRAELSEKKVANKMKELRQLAEYKNNYNSYLDFIAKQKTLLVIFKNQSSILSAMEEVITESKLKKNLSYLQPKTYVDGKQYSTQDVEFKFENILFPQFIDFIENMNNKNIPYLIDSLLIKNDIEKKKSIDVILRFKIILIK